MPYVSVHQCPINQYPVQSCNLYMRSWSYRCVALSAVVRTVHYLQSYKGLSLGKRCITITFGCCTFQLWKRKLREARVYLRRIQRLRRRVWWGRPILSRDRHGHDFQRSYSQQITDFRKSVTQKILRNNSTITDNPWSRVSHCPLAVTPFHHTGPFLAPNSNIYLFIYFIYKFLSFKVLHLIVIYAEQEVNFT